MEKISLYSDVLWVKFFVSSQDPWPRKPLFCLRCHHFPFLQTSTLPNGGPELPRPNSGWSSECSTWRQPGEREGTRKGIWRGAPAEAAQDSRGNSQPKRAALSGVYGSGQHGGPGAAVPPGRDGHKCAVRSDLGAAEGLDSMFYSLNYNLTMNKVIRLMYCCFSPPSNNNFCIIKD